MTSIQDADYIQEVTHCLSQSIANLLRIRPQDPIDYLSQSLRTYRVNHPRHSTRGTGNPQIANPMTSSVGLLDTEQKQTTEESLKTTNISELQMSHPSMKKVIVHHTIHCSDEDENILISKFSNEYSHIDFVHKEFYKVMFDIGDIFDEDDCS